MRAPRWTPLAITAVLTLVVGLVAGCTTPHRARHPEPEVLVQPVQPDFVFGTDGGRTDTLAATVVTDAQRFWSRTYPELSGKPWQKLDGGFVSVDTTDTAADPPPCTSDVSDVEGNAYYCSTVDAIVWDRSALLPVLREHYGPAAVAVVLAHEMGHAVQHRLDARSQGDGGSAASPAFTEVVADCYAGAYARWVVAGSSRHLRMTEDQLDRAVRALAGFRDPVGTSDSSTRAHGTAYDRVSAFQDGYRDGAGRCAALTPERRTLTSERAELSHRDSGNRPAREVLRSETDGLDARFGAVLGARGAHWTPPTFGRSGSRCSPPHGRSSPAITYCPATNSLTVDHRELARLNYAVGDQATATILASRYARAALHQLRPKTTGEHPDLARAAACLTGAHTRWLLRGNGTGMTAGDLDEAVASVLSGEAVTPPGALTGFDALHAFRTGVRSGAAACRR